MRQQPHIHLVRDPATGIEAIRARFTGHAYDMHRHDEWLVGVTERGVQDFFCRGSRQRSTTGRTILIEPHEMHDGQAITQAGFRYCMLYLPQNWLRAQLAQLGMQLSGFRTTLCSDRPLGDAIRTACRTLEASSGRLANDAALDAVIERLRPYATGVAREIPAHRSLAARRARERLHDQLAEDYGADELARSAGAADRFQLARAFRAAYGTSPHAYLLQIRLAAARRQLARGERLIDVAFACGFADQSHLGRCFRRAYGVTPGTYRDCCTGVPDDPH